MERDTQLRQVSPTRIREVLADYLSPVPDRLENKVSKYLDLLGLWGRKVSLTSIGDPEEILRFHFGESLFALRVLGEEAHGRLADVGTGAGFPGLAIKLGDSNLFVDLVEPNKKKSAFLHEVIRCLELSDIAVISSPFQSAQIKEASLSFITCRALGKYPALLRWAREKLKPGGSLLLWVGGKDALAVARAPGWRWGDPVLIPHSHARFILKGTLGS